MFIRRCVIALALLLVLAAPASAQQPVQHLVHAALVSAQRGAFP